MVNPTVYVDPPHREPRRGGIKQVTGEFQLLPRVGAAENVEYISDGCAWPSLAPGLCWGAVVAGPKTYAGFAVESGITTIFGQYVGVQCTLGEGNEAVFVERAKRQLASGEDHEVEAALIAWAAGGTAGGTGTIATAIALADEWADQKYLGTAVMIMSRASAVLGDGAGVLSGDGKGNIWTINGTPVVTSWVAANDKVFVIGWPTVYASDVTVSAAQNITQNQEMALAERAYAIAVDCLFRGVVTVTGGPAQQDPDPVEEQFVLSIGTQPASPIPDGTDTTITVLADSAPDEVFLFYRINGGAWVNNGEMTEVGPLEFVETVDGALASAGDVVDLYATAGSSMSPIITVNVT